MKSIKLLACLVTLQFTSGLTLEAADQQTFREWTDAKGRQITARLVEASDSGSVKIERKDGQFFTVAVTVFSEADQAYVKTTRAAQKTEGAARVTATETVESAKADNSVTTVDSTARKGKFAASSGSTSARSGTGGGIGGNSEQISFFGVPLTTP